MQTCQTARKNFNTLSIGLKDCKNFVKTNIDDSFFSESDMAVNKEGKKRLFCVFKEVSITLSNQRSEVSLAVKSKEDKAK